MSRTVTITHRCGHDAEHRLAADGKERERLAAWTARQLCPSCRRQAEAEAAGTAAAAAGLPALRGTPRQITTAEGLRKEALRAAELEEPRLNRPVGAGAVARLAADRGIDEAAVRDALEAANAVGRAAVAELRAQADADWWLDRLDLMPYYVAHRMRDERERLLPAATAKQAPQ